MIAALVIDPRYQRHLEQAVASLMPIIWCTSLVDLLEHASQARMIIAEPFDSAGVPSAPTLALIRHRQPDTAFLAYIGLTAPSARALRLMVLAGVTDVVIRDVDGAEVVLRQIVQYRITGDFMNARATVNSTAATPIFVEIRAAL